MGAIVTKKQSNMSWTITWKAAGRYPIVADRIYATLADAQAYVDDTSATASAVPGLVISVVNDPIEKNNGIYYVSKIANTEDAEKSGFPISAKGELVKAGSGAGSMTSANFEVVDGKVTAATADNIGQIIYITGGTEDYPAGPYIVTGIGSVSRLGTTSATGNIAGDVETLKTDVNNLKAKDTELAGSIAGVSDIANANKTAVEKLNGVVFEDGVLVLAKSSDVYTKGEIDGTLADYVKVADYNEFVESTASNFQSINNTINGLGDTYATITSVDDVKTSVQTLSGTVDTKAAQSDLEAATGRIDTLETAVNETIPKTYATKTELQGLADTVNALPTYEIKKLDLAEEGFAASYKLMKGETQVGATINIPKDMVVESGVVRKLTEDEVAASKGEANVEYIVLTLSNATDDKLYIKASSLVDIYKKGDYVTISDDKVISVDVDSVYTTIETTMLSKQTFATPAEVEAAQSAAEQDALNKANAAKDAAIADTTTKLANYTTTADLVNNYATKENLAAEKEALAKSIADNVSDIDARLDLVESQLGLGGGEDGEDLSLVEQVIHDVASLKNAVGTTASTDDEGNPVAATGLQLDVDNLKAKDIELSGKISTLDDTAVKTISLNGSELTPVSGTITIDVANEIKAEGNTETALISLGAAKNYVDSKVSTINLSLETLETEKASIKLVASDSDATATNVIYLVGDAKAPKVVIDGALHTIGSNLYAAIDKYATAEEGGLMAAADKSKLDDIGAIDPADIEAKINEINASI